MDILYGFYDDSLLKESNCCFKLLHSNLIDIDYFQNPPEDGSMAAPVVETPDSPPVLESSPVSLAADPTPIFAQPITEQVAETTSVMKSPV